MRTYTSLRITSAIVGVLVIMNDTLQNIFNQWLQTGSLLDPTVMSTLVIAVATAMGAFVVTECWQSKRYAERVLGTILLVGVLVGATFSFTQSIERISHQRVTYLKTLAHAQEVKMRKSDKNLVAAKMIELEIVRKGLRGTVQAECKTDKERYDPRVHTASNFPLCDPAYRELERLEQAKAAYEGLAETPIEVALWTVDPAAQRLALVVPLSQETLSLYLPWLLPTALLLFGFTLFAWGMAGETVVNEFDLTLQGDAALVDKAERFTADYKAANGVWPTKDQVAKVSGLSPQRADTVRKRIMARRKKK